jgi:hypothetical protein
MPISVEKVLNLPLLESARVVAGKNGLSRQVESVAIVGAGDCITNLVSGAIALADDTVSQTDPSFSWSTVIGTLAHKNAAALIVNIGQDVTGLQEGPLSLADSYQLPIITLQRKVSTQQLINTIMYEVLRSEIHDFDHDDESLIHDLILGNSRAQQVKQRLYSLGWSPHKTFGVITVRSDTPTSFVSFKEVSEQVGFDYCMKAYNNFVCAADLDGLDNPGDKLMHKALALHGKLTERRPDAKFCVGMGSCYKTILMLAHSHYEARAALYMNLLRETPKPVLAYGDLGLFGILLDPKNSKAVKQVLDSSLGMLGKFDKEHHSNYMETLRIFCRNALSITKTAKDMSVHYNTVRYRIDRIAGILDNEGFPREDLRMTASILCKLADWQQLYDEDELIEQDSPEI